MSQTLADRLDAVAEHTRGGRSEVIRRALDAYLDGVPAAVDPDPRRRAAAEAAAEAAT